MDWPPGQFGDYGSFLEMAFAINVLFCTWSKPGVALTNWLIQRARRERENSRVELPQTVSKRIFKFQNECGQSIPRWRWTAGVVALVILLAEFNLADDASVNIWGALAVAATMFPLLGVTIFLGIPARNCARKNHNELKPQLRTMGGLDIEEIGNAISQGQDRDG